MRHMINMFDASGGEKYERKQILAFWLERKESRKGEIPNDGLKI